MESMLEIVSYEQMFAGVNDGENFKRSWNDCDGLVVML